MRMTVATCVMLLELTNNLALLPLMMLVTLVAKVGCTHATAQQLSHPSPLPQSLLLCVAIVSLFPTATACA